MAGLRSVLQDLVNKSESEKVEIAARSYLELLPTLKKYDFKNNGLGLLWGILSSAISADGQLNNEEYRLASAIMSVEGLDMSHSDMLGMIQKYQSQETYQMVQKLSEILNGDDKDSLIVLVAAICAVDDRINPDEFKFIDSLT